MSTYIDLAFFESYTRTDYTASTTPTDTFVQELIDDSEAEINEVTGRTWGLTTNTLELYDEPEYEVLLKKSPVISVTQVTDGDSNVLTEGIDNDYTVDGNFVILNKKKARPVRIYVTYTSGYTNVRTDVKLLCTLLTLQKIIQSSTTSNDNTESISVGSISITSKIGVSNTINIDSDVAKIYKRLRRIVR